MKAFLPSALNGFFNHSFSSVSIPLLTGSTVLYHVRTQYRGQLVDDGSNCITVYV